MNVEAEALDSTFYFILFFLSMMAAGAGQFLINHGQGQLSYNKQELYDDS